MSIKDAQPERLKFAHSKKQRKRRWAMMGNGAAQANRIERGGEYEVALFGTDVCRSGGGCPSFDDSYGRRNAEGWTWSGKSTSQGKMTEINQIFKCGTFGCVDVVVAYTEDGTLSGDNQVTIHCFGTRLQLKSMRETHGYCIDTYPDRDEIVWKVTTEPRHAGDGGVIHGAGEAVMGTGKFAKVSATQTFTCLESVKWPAMTEFSLE
jgi:hypothetical protein